MAVRVGEHGAEVVGPELRALGRLAVRHRGGAGVERGGRGSGAPLPGRRQFDFILVVVVADMAAYEAFTRDHLLSDANVRSFTTHVALGRIKTGLTLAVR